MERLNWGNRFGFGIQIKTETKKEIPAIWPGFLNKPNLVNFIVYTENFSSPQKIVFSTTIH